MNLYAAVAVALGMAIVAYALQTAIRTFLLPQPGLSALGWAVFRTVRPVVVALDRLPGPGGRRQTWVKLYAPLCLVVMVFATMVIVSLGYAAIFSGIGATSLEDAFLVSLSSISTLGFAPLGEGLIVPVLASVETMTGILVVALLIGYLPTIYAAVQHRERGIAALEVKVGSPVTAGSLVRFCCRPSGKEDCDRLWADGTEWFTTLAHSHDSMAELIFVDSPRPGRSWVDTVGAVLDASSLVASALEGPSGQRADVCAIAGANALRVIVDSARPALTAHVRSNGEAVPFPKADFDSALAALENAGLPVITDRASAWAAFADRRRAYAHSVVALECAALLHRPNHPA